MSRTDPLKVREEAVSTSLSAILDEHGIPNVSLLQAVKVPDIYLIVGGVRVIIETKEIGQSAELDRQLAGRLAEALCEVAIGIEYPDSVSKGRLAELTPGEIRKRLSSAKLLGRAIVHSSSGGKRIFDGVQLRADELPELLNRAAAEAMPSDQLDRAVSQIRESVGTFAQEMSSATGSTAIGERIRKVLDLGE